MKRKENDLNQSSIIMFQPLICRGVSAKTNFILELKFWNKALRNFFHGEVFWSKLGVAQLYLQGVSWSDVNSTETDKQHIDILVVGAW